MAWTHDNRDETRTAYGAAGAAGRTAATATLTADRSRLGIPRILGRRARWVGARLRHVRD